MGDHDLMQFNGISRASIAALLLLAGASLSAPARGDSGASRAVTFSHDIAPIVYAHCAACHRDGEAAPFALLSYQQVKKHAEQIVDVTGKRVMPPWKARQEFGEFLGDRRISGDQIDLLRRWKQQGCPEGDPAATPEPPHFAEGWQLGSPDMIVKMPEAYNLAADGRDVYRCFVIPLKVPAGKYIRAVEFRPENRRIVHHAVLTSLRPQEVEKELAAEPAGTGPGFASGLAAPGERLPGPLGIWVPGKDPLPLPDGYAMRWDNASSLVVQLHLHPSGKPEREQSSVGIYFTDQRPRGQLRPVLLFNKEVHIAAGDGQYKLTQSITLPRSVEVIGLFPHMHLLGRTVTTTATFPDGTSRPLLSIADWDFNWQGYYQYAQPLLLPAGTRLDAEWTFDNSAGNPANPSSPPKPVNFGEQTTDEMGVVLLDVIPGRQ
jgi:mono/diheme cytochrome c family protein